mmetsp:Transcript_39979/g.95431  ORF Transcript_39979/g.95431 Transcript_39979/m.95431 type:complete len:206 (+) Transcript_39979:729-1346(+)
MSKVVLGIVPTSSLSGQVELQLWHAAVACQFFIPRLGILRELGEAQALEAAQGTVEVSRVNDLGGALADELRHSPGVIAWQRPSLKCGQQKEQVQRAVHHKGQLPRAQRLPESEKSHLLLVSHRSLFGPVVLFEPALVLSAHVGDPISDPGVEVHVVLGVELQGRGLAEEALVAANQVVPSIWKREEVVAGKAQDLFPAAPLVTN